MTYTPRSISKVFIVHVCSALFCLWGPLAYAQTQENSDELQAQLIDLEEIYAQSEETLQKANTDFDRIITAGYSGAGLRNDLQKITDIVASEKANLDDLGKRIAAYIKKLGGSSIAPLKIIVQRGSKDAKPLTTSAQEGDILYFSVKTERAPELTLDWRIVEPDGQLSERLYKQEIVPPSTEEQRHSFGINTTGMAEGMYQIVLAYQLASEPNKTLKSKAEFELGSGIKTVKLLRLVVDDEKAGDTHQPVLGADASAYLFAYYQVPQDVNALTIRFRLRDWTDKKTIFEKTGRRNTKPNMEEQRVGILLNKDEVPFEIGHRYRFDIRLTDDLRMDTSAEPHKTQSKGIFFYYGKEPKQIKIEEVTVGTSAYTEKNMADIPKQDGPLYVSLWYKASGGVENININIKLYSQSDDTIILQQNIERAVDPDREVQKLSLPVAIDKFVEDTRYRIEFQIAGKDLKPEKSGRNFNYAKLPPVDIKKYVQVSGIIQTPGFPDVQIKETGKNIFRKNSTLVFTVPAHQVPGLKGRLVWRCNYGCGVGKTIKLDENNADWGYSFTVKKRGRGFSGLTLTYSGDGKSVRLYSPKFRIEHPFHVGVLPEQDLQYFKNNPKFFPWDIKRTRLKIRSNGHAVNANVSVKISQSNNGPAIKTITKSMALPTDKWVELDLNLDPALFKFDLASQFPRINKYSFSKDIDIEGEITDTNGYHGKISESRGVSLFRLGKDNLRKGPNEPGNTLVYTIIPPPGMTGPFTSSIYGLSVYYMDGLNWYYDPDKLEDWVREVGAQKYKEDDEMIYYKKTVPLLITIEDSTGKQAALFYNKFTYSVGIHKNEE